MSENEASKTAMQIASSLASDVYKDGLQPSVKTVGETLAGIFKAIGHYPRLWGMMSDASLEQKENLFKEKLKAAVEKIPENRRVLPKPNILGPSMQALEYGIFEEHLREMFANLLASSMDSAKTSIVHPAFVEILKQITKDEALILQEMARSVSFIEENEGDKQNTFRRYLFNGNLPMWPIMRAFRRINTKSKALITEGILGIPVILEDRESLPSYTRNLERLGIITSHYESHLAKYESHSPEVKVDEEATSNMYKELETLIRQNYLGVFVISPEELSFEKGYVKLTPLGVQLIFATVFPSDGKIGKYFLTP